MTLHFSGISNERYYVDLGMRTPVTDFLSEKSRTVTIDALGAYQYVSDHQLADHRSILNRSSKRRAH